MLWEPPSIILEGNGCGLISISSNPPPGSLTTYNLVMGCAIECKIRPEDHPESIVVNIGNNDNGPPTPQEYQRACYAARMVHALYVRPNARINVSCQAGLNRSALVVALAMRLHGFPARQTVKMIRDRRGSAALCNEWFEALVLKADPISLHPK
jgi:protein-tyrosine phosphatase